MNQGCAGSSAISTNFPSGERPDTFITVLIPEFVPAVWWHHLLHNQTALRLKARLLFEPWVTVTSVPWVIQGADR